MSCISLATNAWFIQIQYIIMAVSRHFEINIGDPVNMIITCEGNMSAL